MRGSDEYPDAENVHPDGIFWHPDTPRGIRMRRAGCADSNATERETTKNHLFGAKKNAFI